MRPRTQIPANLLSYFLGICNIVAHFQPRENECLRGDSHAPGVEEGFFSKLQTWGVWFLLVHHKWCAKFGAESLTCASDQRWYNSDTRIVGLPGAW